MPVRRENSSPPTAGLSSGHLGTTNYFAYTSIRPRPPPTTTTGRFAARANYFPTRRGLRASRTIPTRTNSSADRRAAYCWYYFPSTPGAFWDAPGTYYFPSTTNTLYARRCSTFRTLTTSVRRVMRPTLRRPKATAHYFLRTNTPRRATATRLAAWNYSTQSASTNTLVSRALRRNYVAYYAATTRRNTRPLSVHRRRRLTPRTNTLGDYFPASSWWTSPCCTVRGAPDRRFRLYRKWPTPSRDRHFRSRSEAKWTTEIRMNMSASRRPNRFRNYGSTTSEAIPRKLRVLALDSPW